MKHRLPNLPPDWIRSDDLRAELERGRTVREWGDWLESFVWDQFATFTFGRTGVTVYYARRAFGSLVQRLHQRAQRRVGWFMVIEVGRAGHVHIHTLLDTGGLSPSAVHRAWKGQGRSAIDRYEPWRGGAHYATKAITDDAADWDVSRRLRRAM